MPGRASLQHSTASRPRPTDDADPRTTLPPAVDSLPRDWSEVGRRVLAEAQRRATEELIRRGAMPTPVVPHFPPQRPATGSRAKIHLPEVSS